MNIVALLRRHWVLTAVVLIVIIVGLIVLWRREGKGNPGFRIEKVERGNIEIRILSTGIVQPENRLEIKSPVSGRIETVNVKEGDVVKKGQLLLVMSSSERAALLDAARMRGADELARWEDFYKPASILAPIDGTIILRSFEPGQTVTPSDVIFVMSDRLSIEAQVDETDIGKIHPGQLAQVVLDAYPSNVIPAYVDRIAYEAKTVNNVTTYTAYVIPEEIPDFLRSGMTANVSFLLELKQDVLVVPNESVKTESGKSYVILERTNGVAESPVGREIETGDTDGKYTEVLSGLEEGELIEVPVLKLDVGGPGGVNPFSPFSRRKQDTKSK